MCPEVLIGLRRANTEIWRGTLYRIFVAHSEDMLGGLASLIAAFITLAGMAIQLLVPVAAFAQTENAPLNVGVYVSAPFVQFEGDGNYSGMAIELWETIAQRMGLDYQYVGYPSFRALVEATESSEIDVAVTNLTITRARAEIISFTQPWYDAGLRIMVPDRGGTNGFWDVIEGLRDAGHLRAYAWLLFVIVLATIGFTIFDRKFDPDFPKRWREGVAESFYHVMSIATSGRTSRKNLFGWVGRIWQAIWLLIGIGVIAYITSSITSIMTAVSLTQGISSLADLPGKTVAVFEGSVSEDYMTELGITTVAYPGIDESVEAMHAGQVNAVVGDAPVLEHYAHTNSGQELAVVGNIFHPDKYGFAFPHDSELTRPVTLHILDLIEDGTLAQIRTRYFGDENL
ncbi:ABC-type amino acid transport/signal transduction systems, periplasmic component/domain [Mesorhizobium sp. J18]|uniref:transporter substrate-binding domain-containing protein n=1 Tax=Mesorhizobium sp. J18 TaxID=935263 RepID=UPI0011992E9B|nr:transporter substrate-binding domain-containing protein [Mesorhizobium sp. J18]TWG91112.1 ABC-type amino acid transport/signal transduction systems, periplasmic component/domain [Mesorhizobium sp. J18]